MPKIYKAKLEYQSDEDIQQNVGSSTSIMFQSEFSAGDHLVHAVMRWFANRHRAVPEYFGRLCAVTIYGQRFSEIDHDGSLDTSSVGPVTEWKIDAYRIPKDASLEAIGWKTEDLSHLARVIQGVH